MQIFIFSFIALSNVKNIPASFWPNTESDSQSDPRKLLQTLAGTTVSQPKNKISFKNVVFAKMNVLFGVFNDKFFL